VLKGLALKLVIFCCLALGGGVAHGEGVEVQIEGVDGELLANVKALLTMEQERETEGLTGFQLRRYHKRAEREIRSALEPFGYYQVSVESELEQRDGRWWARYRIDPGPQVTLQSVDVRLQGEGEQAPELRAVLDAFALSAGEPLIHVRYEEAKKALQQRALALGYLDARYQEARVEVDATAAQARVILVLATGIRYELGEVTFEGSELRPRLLEAFVDFSPGDAYSARRLLQLQRALEDSDFFSQVEVIPDRAAAEGRRIPIQVRLTPGPPNKYQIGAGFGTDTGPRARLGWNNRRVNRAGHQAQVEYRISQIYEGVTGRYRIPLEKVRTDFLELNGVVGNQDTDTATSDFHRLALVQSVLWGKWRRALSLTYQNEDFEVGGLHDNTTLVYPGLAVNRVWGPGVILVDGGARLQLEIRGGSDAVLSDLSFGQARADTKLIQSLGGSGRVLLRGSVGATATDSFDGLPPSIRYFAGGDNSVRGYEYNSLGPKDSDGDVVGGRYLLVGSAEYEYRLWGKWGAAVFYDVGNALDSFDDRLKHGAGVGVRWESPIGMVRVDVASALSEDDNPLRLHITVGPDL
jgi:translocation and assembly module TamA